MSRYLITGGAGCVGSAALRHLATHGHEVLAYDNLVEGHHRAVGQNRLVVGDIADTELLTGTLPFDEVPWQFAGREAGGEIERLSLSYFLSYPPPRNLNPNTPEALERITYRCLTVMEYGLAELEEELVDFLRKD